MHVSLGGHFPLPQPSNGNWLSLNNALGVERSVCSVAEVDHQILTIRQKENGRISIPWCLYVFIQLVDAVVQCCSNSVMHSLDIHAWLAVTGKIDTSCKFTILCQILEDKHFF